MERLLGDDRNDIKPKKIYVSGYSLGAALATLAFCWLLEALPLENPSFPAHKIILVTAGSPRVGDKKMRERVMEKMQVLRQMDRAVICRLVYNNDLVPHIPFHSYGYRHLERLVFLSPDGDVIINPKLKFSRNFKEVYGFFKSFWKDEKVKRMAVVADKQASPGQNTEVQDGGKTAFEKEVESAAGPVADVRFCFVLFCSFIASCVCLLKGKAFINVHFPAFSFEQHMHFFYLKALLKLKEQEDRDGTPCALGAEHSTPPPCHE